MKRYFICLLMLTKVLAHAQNLVPNPGFEDLYRCPGSWNYKAADRLLVPGWISPSAGTPDIFNSCAAVGGAGVPYNFAGVAESHSGMGYAGMYVWNKNRNYREFIQTKITHPLEKGKVYDIEFFFKLAGYSRYCIDRIGILVSDSLCCYDHDSLLPSRSALLKIYDSAFHRSSGTWEKVRLTYTAKGGEQFLTIGNFSSNAHTKSFGIEYEQVQEPMLATSAYFYIDDVSLVEESHAVEPVLANKKENVFAPGEIYILKNIAFEYDQYHLLPISYAELDKVVSALKAHPDWKVQLTGHTDDIGSDDYNLVLSRNRAGSCANYLNAAGISVDRMEVFGKGKSEPITIGSRAANRRVEAKFIKP